MPRSKNTRDAVRRSGSGSASGGGDGAATEGLETWAAGAGFNDSVTPFIAGIVYYEPAAGASVIFETIANAGNETVDAQVELWDASNGVSIVIDSFTGVGATVAALQSNALTVGTPGAGVIAAALTRYEIRIYIDASTDPTDFVEHWKSRFVNGAP